MTSERELIPLDKSWMMRMGVLDTVHGYPDIINFLENEEELGDDLKVLLRAARAWPEGEPIDVGESGTLYRFLKFASWKLGARKKFILRGTLRMRKITDDALIVKKNLAELLELDGGTSQWASAAVLFGSEEKIKNPPYKLALTYEAVRHWRERRNEGKMWEPRYDETIVGQLEAFLRAMEGEAMEFEPRHSEDYCFARAFGFVTPKEGERRWPSLRGHESDRISEMERALGALEKGEQVDSRDHRVIQAVAMLAKARNQKVRLLHPEAVSKSWPQFWRVMEEL